MPYVHLSNKALASLVYNSVPEGLVFISQSGSYTPFLLKVLAFFSKSGAVLRIPHQLVAAVQPVQFTKIIPALS